MHSSKRPKTTSQAYPFKYKSIGVFHNLGRHLERTFELWGIKKPSPGIKAKRSLIFLSCLLIIALWPISNLFSNFLIILLSWIVLSLTEKPVNHWLLMLNIQFNIAWLFYLVNFLLFLLK